MAGTSQRTRWAQVLGTLAAIAIASGSYVLRSLDAERRSRQNAIDQAHGSAVIATSAYGVAADLTPRLSAGVGSVFALGTSGDAHALVARALRAGMEVAQPATASSAVGHPAVDPYHGGEVTTNDPFSDPRFIEELRKEDESVMHSDPKDAKGFCDRGRVFHRTGRFDKAIADYTKALQIDRTSAEAYIGRGDSFDSKSEFDDAIRDYTEAIRIDPTYRYAYLVRGRAFRQKREFDKAVADFSEILRLRKRQTDYDEDTYYERGLAYFCERDFDNAIADFTEALRENPGLVEIHVDRGNAFYEKEEVEKAISDYTTALRYYPKNADIYRRRATAYQKKGDAPAANADRAKAAKLAK